MKAFTALICHPESDSASFYEADTIEEAQKIIDTFEPVQEMISYIFSREEIESASLRCKH